MMDSLIRLHGSISALPFVKDVLIRHGMRVITSWLYCENVGYTLCHSAAGYLL